MNNLVSRPYFDFDPVNRQYRQDMAIAARLLSELKKYSYWTWKHSMRVGADVQKFCLRIGLTERTAHAIGEAAKLHDIGKIMVSHKILDKPKRLNENEKAQMQTHAAAGAELMAGLNSPFFRMARDIAHYHHERIDGKGYYGLKEADIPIAARIVTICDVFDALSSPRHYRGANASRSAEDVLLGMALPGGKYNFSFDNKLLRMFILYKLEDGVTELSAKARAQLKDVVRGGYISHKDQNDIRRQVRPAIPMPNAA